MRTDVTGTELAGAAYRRICAVSRWLAHSTYLLLLLLLLVIMVVVVAVMMMVMLMLMLVLDSGRGQLLVGVSV